MNHGLLSVDEALGRLLAEAKPVAEIEEVGDQRELKVRYKLDGKVGEASFQENSVIVLPAAK